MCRYKCAFLPAPVRTLLSLSLTLTLSLPLSHSDSLSPSPSPSLLGSPFGSRYVNPPSLTRAMGDSAWLLQSIILYAQPYIREHQRIGTFEQWYWRRLLRVPWTARRSKQSIVKEIQDKLNIHWKDWCWSWSSNTLATWCEKLNHWKRLWSGKDWRQEKGATEDEMVGWHHQLNGHEFKQTLGDGEGQGSLVAKSWTQWINWTTTSEKSLYKQTPSQRHSRASLCSIARFSQTPITSSLLWNPWHDTHLNHKIRG